MSVQSAFARAIDFLARSLSTCWRAGNALTVVVLLPFWQRFVAHDEPGASSPFQKWTFAGMLALTLGFLCVAAGGALRLLFRAQPGSELDPLRRLAAHLAPWQRVVVPLLALGAVGSALVAPFLSPAPASGARTLTVFLGFLTVRARHLAWYAGRRYAAGGTVRFASSRVSAAVTFFGSAILGIVGLALTESLRFTAFDSAMAILTVLAVLALLHHAQAMRFVTVGLDGVRLAGWRETFLPWSDFARADAYTDELVLTPVGRGKQVHLGYGTVGQAMRIRLRDGIRGVTARDGDLRTAGSVDPAEALGLVAHLPDEASYRAADVPRETLWRIAEAPRVPGAVRVRVAELLAADAAEDERPRLLRLAELVVEPTAAAALAEVVR